MSDAAQTGHREVFLFSYLWDILDEGAERFARRLVDDLGVTGVALAMAYHDGRFLLPHHSRHRLYYLEPHVTYFRSDPSLYADTPLKPTVWSELGSGADDGFARTKGALDQAGLELLGWTVYCYNQRLATAHPEYAVENAWGVRYLFDLCPAHEAVRAYARALTEDVCRTAGARSLWLESLHYHDFDYTGGVGIVKVTADLDDFQRLLVSLCFCSACMEVAAAAGVDGERVRRGVQVAVDHSMRQPAAMGTPMGDQVQGVAELAAYVQARDRQVQQLNQEVVAIAGRHGTRCFPNVTAMMEPDLPSVEAIRRESARLTAASPHLKPATVLRPGSAGGLTPAYWAEVTRRYVEADVPVIFIYNYGLMEMPILDAMGAVLAEGKP
ncbi:MAG: hypothetical protein CL878_07290 [Dehalococcoidia bacterium]|nr:hypothetical protein [Dehalococcoidia bacterium]